MAYYGRRVTAGDSDVGEIGQNQQRATVYNPMPENGWGHRIGMWGGRDSGVTSPTVRLGVWAVSGAKTPAHRLAYTSPFTMSAIMINGTTGQAYEYAVTNANTSPAPNAIKMYAGHRYAIGPNATGSWGQFAMIAAAKFTGDNKYLYTNNSVSFPSDPFSHDQSVYAGWISAWIEYQPNRKPTATCTSPSGLTTTTTPTFSGTFTDPDSVYGDQMTRYRIQVVRTSDTSLVWDSGNFVATATEQEDSGFDRAYGGTPLVAGVEYMWRCQVADEFGTWSPWTDYTVFTINGGGTLTLTSVSGKQDSRQPTPFTATWNHASSFAMNAVQVRITQGSSVIRASGTIAKSVSHAGTVSVTWAEAFSTYALSWGVSSYAWEMRGRDTTGLWSPWFSQGFSTNTPPNVPHTLSPGNSVATSSLPILRCTATDADGDTVTVKARIKDSDGDVLATRTMTDTGSGVFTYQATSGDLPTYAPYRWDAYSFDGTIYSGGEASEANAVTSTEASFVYAEGPSITLTYPTTEVTSASFTVTWTAADQQKKQVVISKDGDEVYNSGLWTSTLRSITVPSGYIRNGETYDLTVSVTNSAPLTGSETVTFTANYDLPDTITNLVASPEFERFDAVPSAIRLTWDASTDPNFLEYLITRVHADGTSLILARLGSPNQTVFVDELPESGVEYTYQITQAAMEGLDIIVSDPAETQASVALENVVLVNVHDATSGRASLRLDSDRSFEHVDDLVLEHAWGEAAPMAAYGTAQYQTFTGRFTLASDDLGTARDHVDALRSLWRTRATVCYRDERGRRFFGKISKFSEDDRRVQFYTVSLSLIEVGFTEGVD